MTLFKQGKFTSHSGLVLDWKIDCDALSDEDIETIAYVASRMVGTFSGVFGIPTGGERLAKALDKYSNPRAPAQCLIVDDVLTTGKSMEEAAKKLPPSKGFVIFARTNPPEWFDRDWETLCWCARI